MRTQSVTKNVNPSMLHMRRPCGVIDVVADDLFVDRLSFPISEAELSLPEIPSAP